MCFESKLVNLKLSSQINLQMRVWLVLVKLTWGTFGKKCEKCNASGRMCVQWLAQQLLLKQTVLQGKWQGWFSSLLGISFAFTGTGLPLEARKEI